MTRRGFLSATAAATFAAAQATPKRPNILFAIADDWNYGHASAYGCKWINTPAFDRIAREGVLFTHAFTSNPKCSPCRATILTGRNTWQLKEAINHYSIFPNEFAIYPAELERAGYFVGMTGKGWGRETSSRQALRIIRPAASIRSIRSRSAPQTLSM